jgi:hypothetical protein
MDQGRDDLGLRSQGLDEFLYYSCEDGVCLNVSRSKCALCMYPRARNRVTALGQDRG